MVDLGSMALMLQYVCAAVYVAWLVRRYYNLLDLDKQLPPTTPLSSDVSPGTCQYLEHLEGPEKDAGQSIIPVEDLVLYRPGILLGGAGATIECMHHSPERARPGYLVAIDLREGFPKAFKLAIIGLPDGIKFQPHGIFYSNRTERLYTVNHGGVTGVGTRIEVFDVLEGESDELPSLVWRMAVGGNGQFANMALNSVVEGRGRDEIFVTQFQNFAIPDKGEHHPVGLREKLGRIGNFILELLAFRGFTGVHYCTFDIDSGVTKRCAQVNSGFVHANGLTINDERTKLWVNDPIRRSITTYDVGEGGSLKEIPEEHIELPHAVDNIHIDSESGHIFAGSLPLLYEQLNKSAPKHGTFLDIFSVDAKFDKFRDLVVHDGSRLNQISACYRVKSHNGTEWGICGSPLGSGLLACQL